MLKAICDICGIRPADNHFKVKKEIETAFIDMGIVFPKKEWVNVDICKECYQKLVFKSSVKEKVNDKYDNC